MPYSGRGGQRREIEGREEGGSTLTHNTRKDGRSRIFFFLVSFKKFAWATVLSQAPAYFIRGLDPKAAHIPARWSCAVRPALCNHQGCCPGCSLSMKERTKVH